MANQYCRHLSNTYRFSSDGDQLMYQPCCWVPFVEPVSTINELNNARLKIQEQVESNSEQHCRECLNREQLGYRDSERQKANLYIPKDAVDGDAYVLEYQVVTNCNAACAICGPHFSSLWDGKTKDFTKHYETMFNLIEFDRVRLIKFFGGEPLIGNEHRSVLEKIPDPSQVKLFYSTNGSIIPNAETLEIWSKFQHIILSVSIDDIDERFGYIRWPLKFNKVENNVKQFLTLKNVEVVVHCTVSPMNLLFIPGLENWADNLGLTVRFSPCYGPWSIAKATKKLREQALHVLGNEHPAVKILQAYSFNDHMNSLVINLNELDHNRNLHWRETFPGLHDLLT